MTNEYFNYLYNYDAQASGLLGNFDEQNNYKIQEDLKTELLKSNKLITDYKEELISCYATVGAYKFDFRVLIQEGEGHKKRAGLFLIEKATQGFYEEEIQTLIHYVVLPNDGAFIDTVKKTFNLFTRDESEGIDMANAMLQALLKRKKELEAKQFNSISVLYNLDSEYVRKMLAILKGYGLIGDRLIIDFKNIVKAKNLNKLDKTYWKELKIILDKLLISNISVFDSNVLAQIQALQKNYLIAYKEAKIPNIIEVVTPKKVAKKSAVKPIKISDSDFKVQPVSYPKITLLKPSQTETTNTATKNTANSKTKNGKTQGKTSGSTAVKPVVKKESTYTGYKGTFAKYKTSMNSEAIKENEPSRT